MNRASLWHRAGTGLTATLLVACAIGCTTVTASHPATPARTAGPSRTAEPSLQAASITVPNQLDGYTRSPTLEQQMNVTALAAGVAKSSGGTASDLRSAVYEQGGPALAVNSKIFLFVGGTLAHANPAISLANFLGDYPKAGTVSAGSLPGDAACTATISNDRSASMCVWFDAGTFGALVSPTMTTAQLATTLDQVRPSLER